MSKKQAKLYRMVTKKHICPFGIKARYLLKKQNYDVSDYHLKSNKETESFKKEYKVETTPQVFIDGQRVGGYDDLKKFFGLAKPEKKRTYSPIVAIFSTTFLTSLALHWQFYNQFISMQLTMWFIAFSMIILAVLKLRDLESFSNQFLGYDLLAQKFVPYAYIYPFAEVIAGIGMLVSQYQIYVAPISIFIGTIGAISVINAVYIQNRELKCACVGGNSNVPLGFISLVENLMMIFAGLWMITV